MNASFSKSIVRITALGILGGSLLAGAGTAQAATKEHILLARQVNVPMVQVETRTALTLTADQEGATAGWDWEKWDKWNYCAYKVTLAFSKNGWETGSPEIGGAVKEMCEDLKP